MGELKLLQPARKETAYAKVGIYGPMGSGKTFTACLIARGLAAMRKSKKPVAFLDTETGSDYEISRFKEAGLELLVARTRAFKDLLAVTREALENCDILVVDSLTHFWMELCTAWATKLNRAYGKLWMSDYQIVNKDWEPFTNLYTLSHMDIIVCGRAGSTYEYVENEETHKKEFVETGTRMRTQKEMGYEPSLLLEMELLQDVKANTWTQRAWVVKDRTDTINGRFFDKPTFEDLLPALSFIDVSGKAQQNVLDPSRSSVDSLQDADWDAVERSKRVQILIEEIEALFKRYFDRTAKSQAEELDLMQLIFGTRSATQIKAMHLEELQACYKALKAKLEPEPMPEPTREAGEEPIAEGESPTDTASEKGAQILWDGWLASLTPTKQKMVLVCTPLTKLTCMERMALIVEHDGHAKLICEAGEKMYAAKVKEA